MSTEEHKALLRRVYDAFSSGNPDVLDALIAPDAIDHNPVPGQSPGLEGVKQVIGMFRTAFPDFTVRVEDMVAEGDKVVGRITLSGTQHGEFLGMPATGKQFSASGIDIVRIADGKLVERWGNGDDLGMLQQLGVIPTPGQGT